MAAPKEEGGGRKPWEVSKPASFTCYFISYFFFFERGESFILPVSIFNKKKQKIP
jgi:hypothetical protein